MRALLPAGGPDGQHCEAESFRGFSLRYFLGRSCGSFRRIELGKQRSQCSHSLAVTELEAIQNVCITP